MDQANDFLAKLEAIIEKHPKYKLEAYNFLLSGLNYTIRKLPAPRHVSGQELCEGLREFALDQYGPLARLVLEHWGVTTTRDFGEMVFILVGEGMMSKTEEDSVSDFDAVYDFKEAFEKKYEIDLENLDFSLKPETDEEDSEGPEDVSGDS
ncbi:MAG TPA: hypothetical protein PKL97_08595 [Candidatus Omnitrophota bacterium]|nr:hypothetical protein [Candidatus Omnitrophota bacterium]